MAISGNPLEPLIALINTDWDCRAKSVFVREIKWIFFLPDRAFVPAETVRPGWISGRTRFTCLSNFCDYWPALPVQVADRRIGLSLHRLRLPPGLPQPVWLCHWSACQEQCHPS